MGLFDWMGTDPSKKANKYLNQIPGTIKPYYDPYIDAGKGQMAGLEDQYSQLMNDPGAMLNKFGESYQQSPGFDFALKQALQGSGNAMAAGGMAGSPMHEKMNMEIGTGLANQDYNNYLQNAMGMYGKGLSGSEGMYNSGMNSSDALARMLSDNLGNQASNSAAGAQWRNKMNLGMLGLGAAGMSDMFSGRGNNSGGNSGGGGGMDAATMAKIAMMFA